MNSNHLGIILVGRIFLRKVFMMYHYKFYLTECYEKNISFVQRLSIELRHILNLKKLPLKWKLARLVQLFRLAVRLLSAFSCNGLLANTQFTAKSTYLPRIVHSPPFPAPLPSFPQLKLERDLSQPLTFTFVGRICRDKGVDLILDAVKIISGSVPDFTVNIIGNGNLLEDLKRCSKEYQIEHHIKYLGKIPMPEVLHAMRSSLAVIVPSRWPEPAGMVLLESASVGTAVISSRVGGLVELGGKECLFFDKNDVNGLAKSMKYCLNNPSEILSSGLKLQDRVIQNYSIEKHVEALMKLWKSS